MTSLSWVNHVLLIPLEIQNICSIFLLTLPSPLIIFYSFHFFSLIPSLPYSISSPRVGRSILFKLYKRYFLRKYSLQRESSPWLLIPTYVFSISSECFRIFKMKESRGRPLLFKNSVQFWVSAELPLVLGKSSDEINRYYLALNARNASQTYNLSL